MWRFPLSSAGMTWSCGASPLIKGTLLYSFDCYSSGLKWVWCFFSRCPSATSCHQIPSGVVCWSPQEKKGCGLNGNTDQCSRAVSDSLCPRCVQQTVPPGWRDMPLSVCWQLWQPFAVLVLSFHIHCLFSSSAKSKWTACSDIFTNMAPLLSDSPTSTASKPNNGWDYLKTALGFHHPFIHLWYKNNTLFYLWA